MPVETLKFNHPRLSMLETWEHGLWNAIENLGLDAGICPIGGLTICCRFCQLGLLTLSEARASCKVCGFALENAHGRWLEAKTAPEESQREWPAMAPISEEGMRRLELIHPDRQFSLLWKGQKEGLIFEAAIQGFPHYIIKSLHFAHAFRLDGKGHFHLPGNHHPGYEYDGCTVLLSGLDELMLSRYSDMGFCSVDRVIGCTERNGKPLNGRRFRIITAELPGDPQKQTAAIARKIRLAGGSVEAFGIPPHMLASLNESSAMLNAKLQEVFS